MNVKTRFFALALIFTIIIAVSAQTAYNIGYSIGSITNTVIESGSMVSTASYSVFKDSSTYYAKNGITGAIDYSSTNASYVIHSTFSAFPDSVKKIIDLSSCSYTLTTTLIIPNNTQLQNGKLTLANNVNDDMIYSGHTCIGLPDFSIATANITLINLELNGNYGEQTSGSGIHFLNAYKCSIINCYIYNVKEHGIYLDGEEAWTNWHGSCDNVISANTRVEYAQKNGILLEEGSGCNYIQAWVRACGWNGLAMYGATENYITGSYRDNSLGSNILIGGDSRYNEICDVKSNSALYGLQIVEDQNIVVGGSYNSNNVSMRIVANKISISNSILAGNNYEAVYIRGSGNSISDLACINNGLTAPSPAIRINNCSNSIFKGVKIIDDGSGDHTYGLIEEGTSDSNIFMGINSKGCSVSGITIIGVDSHANLCWNETVWIP